MKTLCFANAMNLNNHYGSEFSKDIMGYCRCRTGYTPKL